MVFGWNQKFGVERLYGFFLFLGILVGLVCCFLGCSVCFEDLGGVKVFWKRVLVFWNEQFGSVGRGWIFFVYLVYCEVQKQFYLLDVSQRRVQSLGSMSEFVVLFVFFYYVWVEVQFFGEGYFLGVGGSIVLLGLLGVRCGRGEGSFGVQVQVL